MAAAGKEVVVFTGNSETKERVEPEYVWDFWPCAIFFFPETKRNGRSLCFCQEGKASIKKNRILES